MEDGNGNVLSRMMALDRGYTGHEHLQSIGIINMNGRVYDPILHRFLQADSQIQDPFDTQNYNRYGYVLNNPLSYIDPSGETAQQNGPDNPNNGGMSNGEQIAAGGIIGSIFSFLGSDVGKETIKNVRHWIDHNWDSVVKDVGDGWNYVKNKFRGGKDITTVSKTKFAVANGPSASGGSRGYGVSGSGKGSDLHPYANGTNQIIKSPTKYCKDCVNPETIGKNLLDLTYPGGDNPMTFSNEYSYSYVPSDLSEYPAIGHDRRYDRLEIKGISGLLTDAKAIGADWNFVYEELTIAISPYMSFKERWHAGILGTGLGLFALPKTLGQIYSNPGIWFGQAQIWYNVSSYGVTNSPSPHIHKQK